MEVGMPTVSMREVQHNLAGFLRKVELGEEIEIRRRSRVVARLVPAGAAAARVPDWDELRQWRRRIWRGARVRGKTVSELVSEGRTCMPEDWCCAR